MAGPGWKGSVATATGVAAGVSAAQLGLGYGLGVVAWVPSAARAGDVTWVSGLTWAFWIAATSTVAGALVAQRLGSSAAPTAPSGARRAGIADGLHRLLLAVAAAIGALLTALLVGVPARTATEAQTFSPQTVAAGYAILGLLVGLLVAVWALASRPAAANIVATSCWLWLLALIAVVDGVLAGRGLASERLGVWQLATGGDRLWLNDYLYWPGALLSLGSALVIGVFSARRAARGPHRRVGAAAAGGAGPLLVAAAYLVTTPQLTGTGEEQVAAHLVAPYAVLAGLAGSILTAALAQRAEQRTRQQAEQGGEQQAPQEAAGQPAEAAGTVAEVDAEADRPEVGGPAGSVGQPGLGDEPGAGGRIDPIGQPGVGGQGGPVGPASGAAVASPAEPGVPVDAGSEPTTTADQVSAGPADPSGPRHRKPAARKRATPAVPRPRSGDQDPGGQSAGAAEPPRTGDDAPTGPTTAGGQPGEQPAAATPPAETTTASGTADAGAAPATGARGRPTRRPR